GTVLGLIGMFMAMDDPARIGPAMALAMLTTLYGLCLGTILFGTIAARLERLSVAERAWQSGALARLETVVRGQPMAEVWLRKARRPAQ
ncbi:MAG: MotA/TolQ/ExbB proton channel family protein, partial [Sphingomonadales bacterium]